jgi:hypothetical protein
MSPMPEAMIFNKNLKQTGFCWWVIMIGHMPEDLQMMSWVMPQVMSHSLWPLQKLVVMYLVTLIARKYHVISAAVPTRPRKKAEMTLGQHVNAWEGCLHTYLVACISVRRHSEQWRGRVGDQKFQVHRTTVSSDNGYAHKESLNNWSQKRVPGLKSLLKRKRHMTTKENTDILCSSS